eukprot:UN30575
MIFNALITTSTSVLILTDHFEKLFPVCETFLSLLYPFRWPYTYIPVLPRGETGNDLIQAPNVYIMGCCTQHIYLDEVPDYIVRVNLDDNTVKGCENIKLTLPLEFTWRLHRGIKKFCSKFWKGEIHNPEQIPKNAVEQEQGEEDAESATPRARRFTIGRQNPAPRVSYEDIISIASGSESDGGEEEGGKEEQQNSTKQRKNKTK